MADATLKTICEAYPQRQHYLPLKEAAAYAYCHPQTLRKAFRLKELGGFRRGRGLFFRTQDLDKWMGRYEQRARRCNSEA